MSTEFEFEEVVFHNGTIRLHAVAAGPLNGPLVILLHGFPEFWYAWRKQIVALADAGFRVIAPDQRGYNTSSRPAALDDYRIDKLVSDVIAIADQLGHKEFCLAGHDWGAVVAWVAAATCPRRIRRLAILNVPHPEVMRKQLQTNPRQLIRSWYIFMLQIPRLPEAAMKARDFKPLKDTLRKTSLPGAFSEDDLNRYRDAWAEPGALTAMIAWYRAFFRNVLKGAPVIPRIIVPTRILWGDKDAFIVPEAADGSLAQCMNGELIRFPECTHWLHHEQPDRVSELLIEFFRQ
jgi:pimeloyl-ACP methyl ester carboxylesterase